MSTHNIHSHGEIRKMPILIGWQNVLIWSFAGKKKNDFSAVHYAPVICTYCPSALREGWGLAGLMCRAVFNALAVLGKYRVCDFALK